MNAQKIQQLTNAIQQNIEALNAECCQSCDTTTGAQGPQSQAWNPMYGSSWTNGGVGTRFPQFGAFKSPHSTYGPYSFWPGYGYGWGGSGSQFPTQFTNTSNGYWGYPSWAQSYPSNFGYNPYVNSGFTSPSYGTYGSGQPWVGNPQGLGCCPTPWGGTPGYAYGPSSFYFGSTPGFGFPTTPYGWPGFGQNQGCCDPMTGVNPWQTANGPTGVVDMPMAA